MTILKGDMRTLLCKAVELAVALEDVYPLNPVLSVNVDTAYATISITGSNEEELEKNQNAMSDFRHRLKKVLNDLTAMAEISEICSQSYWEDADSGEQMATWVFYVRYSENLQIAT